MSGIGAVREGGADTGLAESAVSFVRAWRRLDAAK